MAVSPDDPVKYSLRLDEELIPMNEFLGSEITLSFNGQINCIACGRLTSKSFAGGFCFPCMQNTPENSECIIRPELCEAHLGKGRDPVWEKKNHLQPHTVYLALSSGVKVGVTRNSQIPTRWIDQGASKAIRLAEVPNRYLAGKIEVSLKDILSDKTAWQRMLKNEIDESKDLASMKEKARDFLDEELSQYVIDDEGIMQFEYPVIEYPEKVKSISLDKQAEIKGKLLGIKGQYLIFNDGFVMNVRKHSGYYVIFQT